MIRQTGYVVRDLDAAIASWTDLAVGPWLMTRELSLPALYRGASTVPALSIAFAN